AGTRSLRPNVPIALPRTACALRKKYPTLTPMTTNPPSFCTAAPWKGLGCREQALALKTTDVAGPLHHTSPSLHAFLVTILTAILLIGRQECRGRCETRGRGVGAAPLVV